MQRKLLYKIFEKFTDVTDGDPFKLTDTLFSTYTVDDFAYHEDMVYFGVAKYLEEKVIPHKIEVFKAGQYLIKFDALFKVDRQQFLANLHIHDLSKFCAEEAIAYAMHKFNDPDAKPDPAFEQAWHHHKMHNAHHPEYWLNPNRSGMCEPIEIPSIYVAEMVADWIGAGAVYGNPLEKWLPDNLPKFKFHSKTAEKVQATLLAIGIKAKWIIDQEKLICT